MGINSAFKGLILYFHIFFRSPYFLFSLDIFGFVCNFFLLNDNEQYIGKGVEVICLVLVAALAGS
jgi:hypothetical protein